MLLSRQTVAPRLVRGGARPAVASRAPVRALRAPMVALRAAAEAKTATKTKKDTGEVHRGVNGRC